MLEGKHTFATQVETEHGVMRSALAPETMRRMCKAFLQSTVGNEDSIQ